MAYETVANVGDIAPGDILPIAVAGVQMILYRDGDRYFAAQRRCLHHGADLADGILSRGSIICAQHGWRFDAISGCHEMSPDACLATYRVRVDGERIQVDPTPIRRAAGAESTTGGTE